MRVRKFAIAALLAMPMAALAVQPDIQPGEWEMSTITSFPGTPMPEQRESARECVTQEDVQEGLAFDVDAEECELTNMDVRDDGMTYTMTCQHEEGMDMVMSAEMQFLGDRVQGTMDAQMRTPMGPMEMNVRLEGHRVGDC